MIRTVDEIQGILEFMRSAERLKDALRSAHTSSGRQESVAEHTWRLCLLATLVAPDYDDLDELRLLKICIVHDLGEAIRGDVPAVRQEAGVSKAAEERADLARLITPLSEATRAELLALWDEYEAAATAEARLAKALDKLETLIQHNQGANPPDFDYEFNLSYGAERTDLDDLTRTMRRILDEETASRAAMQERAKG